MSGVAQIGMVLLKSTQSGEGTGGSGWVQLKPRLPRVRGEFLIITPF